ncbi:glycosyltransferase family 2 protein [Oenococcus oeni]|uniref:glycosyltransferase family 2 protein n=1 Tax=Oenococcus oeni TaxID=1247 RepID=UPI00178C1883
MKISHFKILSSIIVPVLNGENYILNILNDLKEQDEPGQVEYLIVDNGSTDHTVSLIKKFINSIPNDHRFILYFEKRMGVSNARNLGIKKSHGKYIIFVDADDRLKRTFVSSYVSKIENDEADIEFFPFLKVCTLDSEEKNEIIHNDINYAKLARRNFYSSEELLKLIFRFRLHGYPFAYISKRSLWKSNSFPAQISFTEDLLAIANLLVFNDVKAKINSQPYYFYVQRNNSVVHRVGWKEASEAERVAKIIITNVARRFHNRRLTSLAQNLIYGQYYFQLELSIVAEDTIKFLYYRNLLFTNFILTSMPFKSRIARFILLIFLIPRKMKIAEVYFILRRQRY